MTGIFIHYLISYLAKVNLILQMQKLGLREVNVSPMGFEQVGGRDLT